MINRKDVKLLFEFWWIIKIFPPSKNHKLVMEYVANQNSLRVFLSKLFFWTRQFLWIFENKCTVHNDFGSKCAGVSLSALSQKTRGNQIRVSRLYSQHNFREIWAKNSTICLTTDYIDYASLKGSQVHVFVFSWNCCCGIIFLLKQLGKKIRFVRIFDKKIILTSGKEHRVLNG